MAKIRIRVKVQLSGLVLELSVRTSIEVYIWLVSGFRVMVAVRVYG